MFFYHKIFDPLSPVWRGMLLMAISSLAFVSMHALVKQLSGNLPAYEIAFFRSFLGFLLLAPTFLSHDTFPMRTTRFGLHAIRGLINGVSMLAFFTGVTLTPLAELTALSFTAPIFATILAIFFLGEKVGIRRWSAILIGFLGTLIILRPGFSNIGLGPMLILFAAMFWAIAMMFIKILTRTDSSLTITLYASCWLSLITAIPAYLYWVTPSWYEMLFLIAIAALGTIGQTAMNQSFHEADTSVVLPVDFSKLIWASLLGFILFAEIPDIYTIAGAMLIFGSTTYIGIRESYLRKRQLSTTPNVTPNT